LTGGTIDGSLIIDGGFRVQSQHGHYINFDGYSLTANAGLKVVSGYSLSLAGEAITSWAEVRRNWGSSLSAVDSGTSEVEVREYNRKMIVTTLTSDYTVTFRLLSDNSGSAAWTIRFKTGSTTPHINIEYDISSFIWQNGENILNNLQPNREYRIYIEGNLVMYTIF
jgi:hypothetical protein